MLKCIKVTTLQSEPVNTVCKNLSDSHLSPRGDLTIDSEIWQLEGLGEHRVFLPHFTDEKTETYQGQVPGLSHGISRWRFGA